MKSISRKKPFYKRKKFFVIVLIIIALLAAVSVYALNTTNEQEKDTPSRTSSHQDKDSSPSKKKQEKEAEKPATTDNDQSKDAIQAEDVEPSGADIEAPNITRAEQTGDFIRVSALFSNPSSGSCTLKFEQTGQQTIQTEAPIVVGPSYYTCNGFRVPVSQFPSKGAWNITVTHNLNGKSASSKGTVNVR